MRFTAALGAFNWDATNVAGYVACLFLGTLAVSIVVLVWWAPPHTRRIDLTHLLNEVNGQASMSRFQLLLFTFVIAISLFELVMKNGSLPQVPEGVLTLLGISATTYAVGKGISYSQPDTLKPNPTPDEVARAEAAANQAESHAANARQFAQSAVNAQVASQEAANASRGHADFVQRAAQAAVDAKEVTQAAAGVAGLHAVEATFAAAAAVGAATAQQTESGKDSPGGEPQANGSGPKT
jgi:hypothetical protein